MTVRRRPYRASLGAGLAGSVALHAAAGAAMAVALAWRTLPSPPGPEPALHVVWLPPGEAMPEPATLPAETSGAAAEIAPLAPRVMEGTEPEDALATQVGALHLPPAPERPTEPLPPLPIPLMDTPPSPADPTALFTPPAATLPDVQLPQQLAALAVPHPPVPPAKDEVSEELPLPPPMPPAPPLRRAAALPRMPASQPAPAAQSVALAAPVPAPIAEPGAIPVLS